MAIDYKVAFNYTSKKVDKTFSSLTIGGKKLLI